MKKLFLLVLFILLIGTNLITASDATGSWSGKITHYNINTGTTVTDYQYNINSDKFPVSWDNNRSEIRYSGYSASYYTSRFMDSTISYNFASDFTYRSNNTDGAIIGTIYAWNWSGANKYSYVFPGKPYKVSTGGKSTVFVAKNKIIHLTMNIRIESKKNGSNLVCGSKTFTKAI